MITLMTRKPHNGWRLVFQSAADRSVIPAISFLNKKIRPPELDNQTLLALHPHLSQALGDIVAPPLQGNAAPEINLIIRQNLTALERAGAALRLIQRHFPHQLSSAPEGAPWYRLLGHFFDLVDRAGWFPIDYPLLDAVWRSAVEHKDETGDYFARYLKEIPVACYCPYPSARVMPMHTHLLMGLFNPRYSLDPAELAHLGLTLPLDFSRDRLYDIFQMADFSDEWPLQVIPHIAKVLRKETGNPILDCLIDPTDSAEPPIAPYPTRFYWNRDIERLKAAWQEAQPLVEQIDFFDRWVAVAGIGEFANVIADMLDYYAAETAGWPQ